MSTSTAPIIHEQQHDGAPKTGRQVRVAAIGDLHIRDHIDPGLAETLQRLSDQADLLVIAGDITENGRVPEGELARELFDGLTIPMVAVLGNHDRRGARRIALRRTIESAGISLLDGDATVLNLPDGRRVGIAGAGGYGGGFWPEEARDVPGARLSKAIGLRARRESIRLGKAIETIADMPVDVQLVVLHYAPTTSTLGEEPLIKYWMLGNSLLGQVIDSYPIDLVIHGHAHLGNEIGTTPGGTPVRNVATHVTGGPVLYAVGPGQQVQSLPFPASEEPAGEQS